MTNLSTSLLVEKIGRFDYPIWLLGDSPSAKYLKFKASDPDHLTPLDSRHPSRHTIWTPILDVIQRHLFRLGCRLDDNELFIRNAVSHPDHKLNNPKASKEQIDKFEDNQKKEITELRELLIEHKPFLVLCFGQFAYPFALRTQQDEIKLLPQDEWTNWSIPRLSEEFDNRIKEVQLGKVTMLPLLHASAARGFKSATTHFSGKLSNQRPNYFEYVGEQIAKKLIANHRDQRLDKFMLRG
jgi:hypothetical protein